jgi:hypothetical protein
VDAGLGHYVLHRDADLVAKHLDILKRLRPEAPEF